MRRSIAWGAVLASLFVILSCTSDGDYTPVDFTKTVSAPNPQENSNKAITLRVAVSAMISPKETFVYYRELVEYLGEAIGMDIQMVQRKTYKEVSELFPKGSVDLAFICSGPYAMEKEQYGFEAVATPVVRNSPFYQSYLIVNKESRFRTLSDLKHETFAFTDPDSNTGTLVPTYWLHLLGHTPESFFGKTHYTYSHDNSILTVAKSLVTAAAVDGHKWEYFQKKNNIHTSRTRVIKKSDMFGSPPLVISKNLPLHLKEKLQATILSMHENADGKRILENLLIDRFTEPKDEWYRPIKQMQNALSKQGSEQ